MIYFLPLTAFIALVAAITHAILESLPPDVPEYNYNPPDFRNLPSARNLAMIQANLEALRSPESLSAPVAPLSAPGAAPLSAPGAAPLCPEVIAAINSQIRVGLSKNEIARSHGIPKSGDPNSRYARFSEIFDREKQAIESEVQEAITKVLGGAQ